MKSVDVRLSGIRVRGNAVCGCGPEEQAEADLQSRSGAHGRSVYEAIAVMAASISCDASVDGRATDVARSSVSLLDEDLPAQQHVERAVQFGGVRGGEDQAAGVADAAESARLDVEGDEID